MKPPNRALASALCVVLLTACATDGPPTPPEPEETLHISSVAPVAGPAGTQVTLQGTGFGESGLVRLGGAPVEPDAWSQGEVTLTVPDGAPPAWQSLTLEPDSGGEATAGFFVGHPFEGEPAELQAFLSGVGPGAHVLLPGGDLSQNGLELVLDRVHLHGHPGGTRLGTRPGGVTVVTGHGGSTGLSDLALDASYLGFRSAEAELLASTPDSPTAVVLTALSYTGSTFGPQAGSDPGPIDRLVLEDSRLVVTATARLTAIADVTLRRTEVAAHEVQVADPLAVLIDGSSVVGHALVDVRASEGLAVTGSTLRADDGNVFVWATGDRSAAPPAPGRLVVQASVVEALSQQPGGEGSGTVEFHAWGASLELSGNERIAAAGDIDVVSEGDGDVAIAGNGFAAGVGGDDGSIVIRTATSGDLRVSQNAFAASLEVLVLAERQESPGRSVTFEGNEVSIAGDAASLFRLEANVAECAVTDNVLSVVGSADAETFIGCFTAPELQGLDMLVAGNDVSVPRGNITVQVHRLQRLGQSAESTATIEDNRFVTAGRLYVEVWENGALDPVLRGNTVDAAGVRVRGIGATLVANVVTHRAEGLLYLSIGDGLHVELTDNEFTKVGASSPTAAAVRLVYDDKEGTLAMSGNVLRDQYMPLDLSLRVTDFTATVNDNVFDFPITAPPQAGRFFACCESRAHLDLRGNRWGDVEDADTLLTLLELGTSGEAVMEVLLEPLKTE